MKRIEINTGNLLLTDGKSNACSAVIYSPLKIQTARRKEILEFTYLFISQC